MSLLKYIIKRILIAIPMFIGVIILLWFFIGFIPGDPVEILVSGMGGFGYAPEEIELIRQTVIELYGFDQPFYVQLWRFFVGLFRGEWGLSIGILGSGSFTDVYDIIKIKFPHTLELAIIPAILVNIVAATVGRHIAVHRGEKSDNFFRGIAIMLVSLPSFWVAIQLQFLFSVTLPNLTNDIIKLPTGDLWGPEFAPTSVEIPFITGFRVIDTLFANRVDMFLDTLVHLILPSVVFFMASFGHMVRPARSTMLDVLEADYIRTARAKGCTEKAVTEKHAFRNAIIPFSTFIGFNIGYFISGAAYIENVFNIKGIGGQMVSAFFSSDYFMIRGCLVVFCMINIVVNLIVDVLYAVLDPRIRY